MDCIEGVSQLSNVPIVITHMFRFGMENHIDKKGSDMEPVTKPTGRKRKRDHKHVQLVGEGCKGRSIPQILP